MSNIIVMAFSPRNIAGCLLKKGLQRRGVTGTPGPPSTFSRQISPVQSGIVFYLFTVGAHHKSKIASLEEAFHLASSKFKISELNAYQKLAIRKIVVGKEDIFVNLPT